MAFIPIITAFPLLLLVLLSFAADGQPPPPPEVNVPAHVVLAVTQARNLQAKARLASCQHAVGVLILQGYVQVANATASGGNPQKGQMDLVQVQRQLQQSAALLKADYEEGSAPEEEEIVQCIQLYSRAYGQVHNGQDSGVGAASSSAEITSALGVMMRATSQLQAQLEAQLAQ